MLDNAIIKAQSLIGLEGEQIISSSGATVVGADDKAGVAEIMTAVERLQKDKDRCNIKVVFTPDEEIGRGTDKFNLKDFGADFG